MKIFAFDVDEAWAKKYNELLRDTRRLKLSAAAFAAVLCAIGVGLYFYLGGGAAGTITALVFAATGVAMLVTGWIAATKVGTATDLYRTYPLAPAIVVESNARDIVIMALVNISTDPTTSRPALATRTITQLPGHHGTPGEKIPVTAVSGRRKPGTTTWEEITPMPIAWGTPDEDIITAARTAIPDTHWAILTHHRDRAAEVNRTKYRTLPLD